MTFGFYNRLERRFKIKDLIPKVRTRDHRGRVMTEGESIESLITVCRITAETDFFLGYLRNTSQAL